MGLPRSNRSQLFEEEHLSQSRTRGKRSNATALSQPIPSTSSGHPEASAARKKHYSQPNPPDCTTSEEENQLANNLIRYLLASDKRKQVVNKARIMKTVFGGQGKHFHRTMNKVKDLLSKIFGYRLVELEGNKYMLVNELENSFPHIRPSGTEGGQQVLLFLVLIHIFMHEGSCSEESLWNFLRNLGIDCTDDHHDSYFGDVKHLITEVFVAQKYLNKVALDKNDSSKMEFQWGVRADHEFSRRKALQFVSEVHNGQPISSWPLQYKRLIAWENSNNRQ